MWWDGLVDLVYPPACAACAQVLTAGGRFCSTCEQLLERLPDTSCPRCGEPGDFPDGCPRCQRWSPPFSGAWAAFIHDGAIARAIHHFKYEDHPELAAPLADVLLEEAADFIGDDEALCAVPLHPKRMRQRKYDQAQLLVEVLGSRLGRRPLRQALQRTRETERQVGLSEADRELNVAGAFEARPAVRGQRVLLVDDVLTTGATARAAARALIDAGAQQVRVLTLARAFTAS